MFPLFLTRGETLAHDTTLAAEAGARALAAPGLPPYAAGRPLFLQRGGAGGATECLGRVLGGAADAVTFSWALREALAGAARLFQPRLLLVVPPFLEPMLHTEYQLGLEERATAAGGRVAVEREVVTELVRLRLPAPPARVLEEVLAFARGLRSEGSLSCTLVDARGAVRRVALADESVELHPDAFRAGEPLDLLLRVEAEGRHA